MRFVDDATRYSTVCLLKTKSEAAQAIIDYILNLEKQYHCDVKLFRADNDGEYLKDKLTVFFVQRGIEHGLTLPYFTESNSVAGSLNRSIGEGRRPMLS